MFSGFLRFKLTKQYANLWWAMYQQVCPDNDAFDEVFTRHRVRSLRVGSLSTCSQIQGNELTLADGVVDRIQSINILMCK
ncbi:hypothetical protein MPTK1_4g11730 [Marchantia polymorpha subsp. ruderalis]|uniref:Uncharacterized protein n=2 Tax=Marchantia polymorpha TaxID=3197 RepID=A0AAF6B8X7_MARPO|nr:hypothetical protein MARPO_0011s0158 [Marchantia polymorpha]BBN08461.1 hypothetical protein Mp_4g11730 [Marchantia polymorpha subsp. ruderalis]|eukprot:PTQ46497.1 hypothetical protein MARPO_0011s0158 [Marchantia polymorpha]